MVVGAVLLAISLGCTALRHDLDVRNEWDRGVTVFLISERAGLPDQSTPLGVVRSGATEHFAAAVPSDAERYRFRLVYPSGVYQERADLCLTREALKQSGWHLRVPDTPYTCR